MNEAVFHSNSFLLEDFFIFKFKIGLRLMLFDVCKLIFRKEF